MLTMSLTTDGAATKNHNVAILNGNVKIDTPQTEVTVIIVAAMSSVIIQQKTIDSLRLEDE